MALLTPPDPDGLILLGLDPIVPDQANRSVWSGRTQVVGLPGAETWAIRAALDPMVTEDQERPWRAFLFNFRGRQNIFHYPLPCQQHPGAKPRVNGVATAGYSLSLDGMAPSTTILEAGHYMTVPLPSGHKRMVMLVNDLATNASGQAIAYFNFALGEPPADNVEVETKAPFVPVRSVESTGLSWDNAVSGATLRLEEAL